MQAVSRAALAAAALVLAVSAASAAVATVSASYRLVRQPSYGGSHEENSLFRISRSLGVYARHGAGATITTATIAQSARAKTNCADTVEEPDVAKRARGAFGINAVESLAMGSIVLTNPLHPYVKEHLPTFTRLLWKFPDTLDTILTNIEQYMYRDEIQDTRKLITRHHFDLRSQAPKLLAWLRYVTERLR